MERVKRRNACGGKRSHLRKDERLLEHKFTCVNFNGPIGFIHQFVNQEVSSW